MRICLFAVLFVFSMGQWENVKKIYVDSLGEDGAAAAMRKGISNELIKSGRFEVVDSAEQADAVLSGEGHATHSKDGAKTHYQATVAVTLKDKEQQVLWSKEDSYDAISNKASIMLGHKVGANLVKSATPKVKK
jgi:hypothetical protein